MTEIECFVIECRYQFDYRCTRGEITIQLPKYIEEGKCVTQIIER